MKLRSTCLFRAGLALALLVLAPACMSLEDYTLPPPLAGRLAGDTYVAPGGGWSVAAPIPAGSPRRAAHIGDAAPSSRQTTLIVEHAEDGLQWSVDVLDPRLPGQPALDADFMVGFFEWLATCHDDSTPGARELRTDRSETLDGLPVRWLHAEPVPGTSGERGCLAVLLKHEPYWVVCMVKYTQPARASEAELRARLTELLRSFRVTAR